MSKVRRKNGSTSGWLTPSEASDYLKVPRKTLLRWAREGTVKGNRLSGTKRHVWRFRRRDLDKGGGNGGGTC